MLPLGGYHNRDCDGLRRIVSPCVGLPCLVFHGACRHNASWIVTVARSRINLRNSFATQFYSIFAIFRARITRTQKNRQPPAWDCRNPKPSQSQAVAIPRRQAALRPHHCMYGPFRSCPVPPAHPLPFLEYSLNQGDQSG